MSTAGVEEPLAVGRAHLQVEDRHALLELRQGSHQTAVGVEDHRGAVEDELVLASHRVHVDQGARGIGRPRRQHPLAFRQALGVVRRGVDIDHQLGPCRGLGAHRARRVPGILADRDADERPSYQVQALGPGAGREVALLIEHRVIGQVTFVVNPADLASSTNSSRVVQVDTFVDEADDSGAVFRGLGHLGQGDKVVGHEPGLEQQVFGRVAGDDQLGEHSQVGPRLLSLAQSAQDPFHVPAQVAHHGTELAQSDAQPSHIQGA